MMRSNYFTRYITLPVCILILVVAMPSCKKYLELEPISSFGPDYVFDNVGNAQKAVLGVYSSLGGDNGYGIRLSMYYPYDNDEMMGQGGTPYPDGERRDIAHYNLNSNNTQLPSPFNQLFSGIEKANICIYYLPKMDLYNNGSASDKKELQRLHGEALTLRAQYYFELIRNWGDLPAQFQPSSMETDLFKPKTDRDTLYNKILDDLLLAETLVPWRTQAGTTDERITQGAVRALRARIALFRGGYSLRRNPVQMLRSSDYKTFYQIARDECNVIMQHRTDHTLNPSFQSVFKDAICAHRLEPNGEILWEVAMAGGSSGTGDSKLGYYNGPRYFTSATASIGNSALTILPTYFYTFDSTDLRRDVTCVPYDIATDRTKRPRTLQTMVDGKFRRDWITNPEVLTSNAQYFGLNWPLIRFSDVLLMFAEADNELNNGPTAAGKGAFEEVRKRGFGGNAALIGTTPADYAGFFNAVVKERMLELGAEGIRKYDLIRWNLLGQRLTQTKTQLAALAARQAPYNNLPTNLYLKAGSPDLIWANSFYKPAPATAPAGYTGVAWAGTGVTTTILTYYAASFTPNKSELLPIPQQSIDANPNLKQDFGY